MQTKMNVQCGSFGETVVKWTYILFRDSTEGSEAIHEMKLASLGIATLDHKVERN